MTIKSTCYCDECEKELTSDYPYPIFKVSTNIAGRELVVHFCSMEHVANYFSERLREQNAEVQDDDIE